MKNNLLSRGLLLLGKDKRKKFNLFIILFLISMILETAGIGMVIPILNLLTQNDFHLKINEFITFVNLEQYSNEQLIAFSVSILIILYTAKGLFLTLVSYLQSNFLADIKSNTSDKIFKLYLKKPFSFHLENNSAKLIRNLNDISNFTVFIRSSLVFLTESITFFGVGLLLFIYDPLVSVTSITLLGVLGFLFYKVIRKKSLRWGEERRKFDGSRLLYLQQGFGSIKDVKVLGRENLFIDKFSIYNQSSAVAEYNHAFIMSLPRIYFEWLIILSVGLLFFLLLTLEKSIPSFIPVLGVFAAAAVRLIPSVVRITNSIQSMIFTAPVINNLFQITETAKTDNKHEIDSNKKIIEFKNSIEIKELNYSYPGTKNPIFSNINFKIKYGDVVGVIGPSGVGKTTLINLILGLLKPDKGSILVDKENIYSGIKSWQGQIGYVPQNVYLLDDTLKSNIAFGVSNDQIKEEKVNEAIKKASLTNFFKSVDSRIDVKMGEFGERISGGQRQRIGIARALYNDPKVIILDESTSSLDLDTEKEIVSEINLLKGKKTIIIISHRYSSLTICEKIYELNNQQLIEKKGI